MKRLLETVEEKDQLMGPDMERIADLSIQEKMSTLQTHMKNKREEKKEETTRLLMQQHTTFSEAYKVIQDHMEESVITEGVLRDWPTYYGQVFQQTRQTRQDIQALEKRKSTEEALRSTIEDQIVLETNKL